MSLTIAIPKGRMGQESLAFLCKKGVISYGTFFSDKRTLRFHDSKNDIMFLKIRSQDIGVYVETGVADLGVLGLDLIEEHNFSLYTVFQFPLGVCELSVAYPKDNVEWYQKKNFRVATKYPNLTSNFFFQSGFNIDIIKLYGSIEIAPYTGISDIIVDLVSTGQTLAKNNLIKGDTILRSQACLVMNKSSYFLKQKIFNNIKKKLLTN